MADEWVDLPQCERRAPFEIPPEEAVGRHAQLERRLGGVLQGDRAVTLREREGAEDAAGAGGAFVRMDVRAERVQRGADALCPRQERQRRGGRLGRPIRVRDAVMAARPAHVLAQQLSVQRE